MRFEACVRPLLIRTHQARIACHIGSEDGGETTFDGLLHGFHKPSKANGQTARATIMISCSPSAASIWSAPDAYRELSTIDWGKGLVIGQDPQIYNCRHFHRTAHPPTLVRIFQELLK